VTVKANPTRERVQHRLGLGRKKIIQAYFGTEQQSGMGGLPLLGELESTEGLLAGGAEVLRDWRAAHQTTFSLLQLLIQRVFLICAGYEDGNDSEIHADDFALNLAVSLALHKDEAVSLASQPTVCRFENDMGAFNCYRLACYLVLRYIWMHKKPPKSIRLDFDGSCIPTRGEQQYTSYRAYYETRMYFPLFVFDQDGFLITIVLRPGFDGEAEQTIPVLKRLVSAFRKEWPEVEITVVMDAAFNDPKIYDLCEDNDVFYLIKLRATGKPGGGLYGKSNNLARAAKIAFTKKFGRAKYDGSDITKNSVETNIRKLPKDKRKKELKDLKRRKVHRYGEFEHCTGKGGKDPKSWRQDRRVLVSVVHDDWGDHRSFFVTNIVGLYPEHLIENVYSSRGKAELYIKDAKAFRCDKLSCEEFYANQFRLLMQVLAYQLLYRLRSLLPKSMQTMTLASVRDHFIRIPVIVKDKARVTDLIWSASYSHKNCMHALLQRLKTLHNNQNKCAQDWLLQLQTRVSPHLLIAA